ncbi:hypothetical protein Hs30E_10870 [Lactococcus hodotermopsidis]|uniref:Uncharacterized protein n=1 Tax=Pseudolactococcus hodotermopsidis TaxID=2709157 RepID=A0A6A0BCH1_9LACT|nr:hypothetical protein [Lactococcus hodotermopsidis]GFH42536.1 hypothetical protein Hs30E_10870 [Lactococcus hodotermopsidis]
MCDIINNNSEEITPTILEIFERCSYQNKNNYFEKLGTAIKENLDKYSIPKFKELDFSENPHYDICQKIPSKQNIIDTFGLEEIYQKIIGAENNKEINNIRLLLSLYYKKLPESYSPVILNLKEKIQDYLDNNTSIH